MRFRRVDELWVVYRMPIKGSAGGANAVCTESEWAEMEADRPGQQTLLRSGIRSEAEAERLARGTSGDTLPRGATRPVGPAAVPTM
jgi:hypothetical protein